MVYADGDVLDRQYSFDEIYSHLGECRMTLYTGQVLHVVGATFHKPTKTYYVECANGKELKFRKSAVILIEAIA